MAVSYTKGSTGLRKTFVGKNLTDAQKTQLDSIKTALNTKGFTFKHVKDNVIDGWEAFVVVANADANKDHYDPAIHKAYILIDLNMDRYRHDNGNVYTSAIKTLDSILTIV